MKTALITGISGQDGAYLADYLLGLGYKVIGGMRRSSIPKTNRLNYLGLLENDRLLLEDMDLGDLSSMVSVIKTHKPDEIYNLAAQSFVGVSFSQPHATAQVTGLGLLNLLEAVRICGSTAKIYQAGSSEMFGLVQEIPQNENTPFYPRSPYAVSKVFAHWSAVNYRENYGMFISNGILFNHESPLRGTEFVTRKITKFVAQYACGHAGTLSLGNLSAQRDWGFAPEYVQGMHLMLQQSEPDDFVLATGVTTTVREFAKLSFEVLGIEIAFEGDGLEEFGYNVKNGAKIIDLAPSLFRPSEVELLLGDSAKASEILGWQATVDVGELAKIMVEADVEGIARGF